MTTGPGVSLVISGRFVVGRIPFTIFHRIHKTIAVVLMVWCSILGTYTLKDEGTVAKLSRPGSILSQLVQALACQYHFDSCQFLKSLGHLAWRNGSALGHWAGCNIVQSKWVKKNIKEIQRAFFGRR